mmetsp:Transcript_75260/g.161205  ORF Transcript_75260/g.161205 Transcript_75260/m.161205 type:complete len:823 (+) Transcript_75260:65-2533(+)
MIDFEEIGCKEAEGVYQDFEGRRLRSAQERERQPVKWLPKVSERKVEVEFDDQIERRLFADGNYYSKRDCIQFYGEDNGQLEWDIAGAQAALRPDDALPQRPKQRPEPTPRPGVLYGTTFPSTSTAIVQVGPAWFTDAFHRAGTMPKNVEVIRLRHMQRLGYRAGALCFSLEVEYRPHWEFGNTQLFLKVPWDFEEQHFEPDYLGVEPELVAFNLWAEINFFRLLEMRAPMRMPRYYYGDINDRNEFVLVTGLTWSTAEVAGSSIKPFPLDEAPMEDIYWVYHAVAQMAIRYQSGDFGSAEQLETSMANLRVREPGGDPAQAHWVRGLEDLTFVHQVTGLVDFCTNVASGVFGCMIDGEESLKRIRAALVQVSVNHDKLIAWSSRGPQVLGPTHVDLKGAAKMRVNDEDAIGFTDWRGVCVGPLGKVIWSLYSMGPTSLFYDKEPWKAVYTFSHFFHEGGGALEQADEGWVLGQFIIAAMVQGLKLMTLVPRIYDLCPKERWASVQSLKDVALISREVGGEKCMLYHWVRCLVAMVSFVSKLDMKHLEVIVSGAISTSMHADAGIDIQAVWQGKIPMPRATYRCIKEGTPVYTARTKTSKLVSVAPMSSEWYQAAATKPSTQRGWVHVALPLPGWIPASCVKAMQADEGGRDAKLVGDMQILGSLYQSRRQWVGDNPRHMCWTACMKAQEEMLGSNLSESMLSIRGKPHRVMGSFLAQPTRRPWWPEHYDGWRHHCYLKFEDGAIADITADQWCDDVPLIYFPADASRYSEDTSKAQKARDIVLKEVGIERWRQMQEENGDGKVDRVTTVEWLQTLVNPHSS